jgi:NAD(P)-dependent dehydrogenase (short-subunit alcohol dehydrogenase family)
MLLKDKIALVTGSTNNIGLAIARAFAREGAKVIVHSRHGEEAKKIADEIGGDFFAADLSKPEQVENLFAHIRRKHQRLDLLVNTVAHSSKNDILETTLEEWNRIMTVNLTAYFLCIQHAARMMKENGGGAIINISAASGERGSPGTAVYSVSKGAINALTRQAAVDLAPYKIRVNGIISGIVGTPLGRKDMGNRKMEYDNIPLRRIGQPEDVAEAAVFLASDKSSYITNAILPVDGGRMNSMGSASRG